MKRNIKLGKSIDLSGPNRYTIFYDARTLLEIYCFLFSTGHYLIETEWGETIMNRYDLKKDTFESILADNNMVLV